MSTPPSACPAWCTTDHENAAATRRGLHAAADGLTRFPDGAVHSRAWWQGYTEDPPEVFITFPGSVLNRMSLTPMAAYGLDELLVLLADATPDQHRELAGQVRAAADVLAKGSTS